LLPKHLQKQNNMMRFIEKNASKPNIIYGLLFIVFIITIGFPLFPKLFTDQTIPIKTILDLQFGFTPEFAHELLDNLQDDGRKAYRLTTLFVDIPYALIYGFIYSFILVVLLKKTKNWSKYKLIILVPLLISLFDLLENVGILLLIKTYPNTSTSISVFTSWSNQLKWIFAFITFLLVLFNIIILTAKKFKK